MSEIALRPRSSTELVDAAFQLYRREPLPFIAGLAIIYVPWLIVVAGLRAAGIWSATTLEVGPALGMFAGGMLVYAFAGGLLAVMANDAYLGRGLDVGRAFGVVVSRLGPLLLVLFLFALAVAVGFILFIVPAFYLFARFFAVKQTMLIEGVGVGGAFSRSSSLTQGLKRHVLNAMGLVFLLNLAVSVGVSFLANPIPSQVVQLLISTCASVVVYPIVGIAETLLYYDVRIRREGFDIEFLAAAGSTHPVAPQGF